MHPQNAELIALVHELLERQEAVFDALEPSIGTRDNSIVLERIEAYDDTRKRLRLLVGDASALLLPEGEYAQERRILQEALLGNLDLDIARRKAGMQDNPNFDLSDLNAVADNYLSWFSHWDYAQARLEGAVLVLRAGKIPADLSHLISEIVECYAFQRYTAVATLCRTALEVGLRLIYSQNHLHFPDSANSQYVRAHIYGRRHDQSRRWNLCENPELFVKRTRDGRLLSDTTLDDWTPKLYSLIERLCMLPRYRQAEIDGEPLCDIMHSLRLKANAIVHGNGSADLAASKQLLMWLFQSLHVAYEIEPHRDL